MKASLLALLFTCNACERLPDPVLSALPPRVLPVIQAVEGGRIGSVQLNTNGSEDLGVMQVNSRWVATLAQVTGTSSEVTRARLIDDACFNIAASGAILRTYLNEAGGNLMLAVGYYHSHTSAHRLAYMQRIMLQATSMFGPPQ